MIKLDSNGNVDSSKISDKILGERETRKRLLNHARTYGFEKDMMLLFGKYDKLLRNCTNETEVKDISKLGAIEIYKLLGGYGTLVVDNQIIFNDKI